MNFLLKKITEDHCCRRLKQKELKNISLLQSNQKAAVTIQLDPATDPNKTKNFYICSACHVCTNDMSVRTLRI